MGSWPNQAEIAIGMFSKQCLGDGRIGDIENLKAKTKHWNLELKIPIKKKLKNLKNA